MINEDRKSSYPSSRQKKRLDDFFAKKKNNADVNNDECDISLCTATTTAVSKSEVHCTWKRHSQAANPRKQQQIWGGKFTSFNNSRGLNRSMMLMQVKEESIASFGGSGSEFGGVTIGIGNLLYKPQTVDTIDEERSEIDTSCGSSGDSFQRSGDESVYTDTSEYLIVGKRSLSCTFSTTDDSSIEVSMPNIFNGESEYDEQEAETSDSLYEKVRLAEKKFMEQEARLENQKRVTRDQLLADEVRLVEMTRETKACHLQKDQLLNKLAADANSIVKSRNTEEMNLSVSLQTILDKLKEKHHVFRNSRLREEKQLEEEENRLSEKRRLLQETYQLEEMRLAEQTKEAETRLLEQARLAEERHQAVQKRLDEISRQVELARRNADEARFLVHDEVKFNDTLTFDDTFSVCGDKLHTLSQERSCETIHNCLKEDHWRELDASFFSVRGEKYFYDSKKTPSAPNLFRLLTVDLIQVHEPVMTGFCSHPKGRVQRMLHLEKIRAVDLPDEQKMPAFVFCVNLVLPGPPHYHLCMYFAVDDLGQLGLESSHKRKEKQYSSSLHKFLFGSSDEYRNRVLKMIPRVTEGSFLLKTAVGTKPFILGKYLEQKFVQDERFLEVIVDVSSSAITQKLLKLSSVYTNKIVAGMAFVLEASDEQSLPENIMCSVEVNNDDFDGSVPFFEDSL